MANTDSQLAKKRNDMTNIMSNHGGQHEHEIPSNLPSITISFLISNERVVRQLDALVSNMTMR
ncbi:hypothetical protein [Agrobacterium sp. DSM 25558]|uniref:hypothetical protein n=1 Tax=Agrobacterium sp. DSM 25558 TaxID=1907665 RepID=UPI00097D49E3|nr:hypothetical protein [Agrobacterium sp. DSM 25558]